MRGSVWAIGAAGLLLGRDPSSNVRLHDPLASRKHCRLLWDGGRLLLEDLGARNPVLIAGKARHDGVVRIGETLAVGGELFLVAGETAGAGTSSTSGTDETMSLGHYLSLHLPGDQTIRIENRLSTVEQLAFIFDTAARMGACETEEALLVLMRTRIEERLEPDRLWIIRACRSQSISFYTAGGAANQTVARDLPEAVQAAVREEKPCFTPADETNGAFLVAPMKLASRSVGSLVLQAGARPYRESDLRLLRLFATICASFLHSLQAQAQLLRDNERLRMRAGESLVFVGESAPAQAVCEQALRAAGSDLSVLILGETGTGKELISRTLHRESSRASGPFVLVNCAAIPDELFESQVFGHIKGAFTGAHTDFEGLMAQANGGTLLLDEIGDLSTNNQARILRAIEYGVFHRLGAHEETHVDVRVIAATNKNLHKCLTDGSFREDLYHRLNGFEITIPPLRERKDDIPLLAKHFFELGRSQARRPLEGISDEAMAYLEAQPWPGNVRELRNRILRAISLAESETLNLSDVQTPANGGHAPTPPTQTLQEAEKQHIERVLGECSGQVSEAAKVLGVSRSTLYKKIADLGIDT